MFDTKILVVFVPEGSVSALQACAVPVLRQRFHDDVLPDLPEGTELLPAYTLLRPGTEWAAAAWTADARDGFATDQQQQQQLHEGLIVTASRCRTQLTAQAGVYAINSSSCNRFPWHPTCAHIAARGCSVGPAQLQEAAARLRQQQQQQQQRDTAAAGAASTLWPAQLVPVALLDEQGFLQDLAAAIRAHNTHVLLQQQPHKRQVQLIVPLLLETVQRTAAAVAVQCAWRAHSSRVQQGTAERLLHRRAACAIQRAWRAFVLRRRLDMLAAAAAAYRHASTQLRFSNIMCVDVAGCRLLEAAAERCRQSSALFPEHRLWWVVEPEQGDLFLIDPTSSSDCDFAGGSSTSSSSCAQEEAATRSGLPGWIGVDIPVIPADCSAAQGSMSRARAGQLLELCCSIKELVDPADVQAGCCHPQDVAQLVTFRTRQQAAQRAALLAAFTFDVRSKQYTRLMTVQESPLGAAYRNLTGLSGTTPRHNKGASVTAHGATTNSNSSARAAGSRPQPPAPASSLQGSLQGQEMVSAACEASSLQAVRTAAADTCDALSSRSPRTLGYAVPLQPILPTDTLLAASSSGGSDAAAAAAAAATQRLQFCVSVLSRFPHLVRELAEAEAEAGAAAAAGSSVDAGRSSSSDAAGRDLCLLMSSQPPSALQSRPDVPSLGAYLESTKLQQVDRFKARAAREAEAAAAEAAARIQAQQQAVAAAKAALADAAAGVVEEGTHKLLPDSTAGATAAAQALRRLAAEAAADRVASMRTRLQQEAQQAQAEEAQWRAQAKAAAQADKQALQWRRQREQQELQASAQRRVDTLRQIRAAVLQQGQQQQHSSAFASQVNQLSKYMRNHKAHRAKAVQQSAAAQLVQQQWTAEKEAAAVLQQTRQEQLGAAQAGAVQQQLQLQSDTQAVRAIQQLEAAARRACAAAQHCHEQQRSLREA